MRVAVSKSDPGHVQDPWNYKAFLDGKEVDHAIVADEEMGYVIVCDYSAAQPTLNGPRMEKLEGKVEIIYKGSEAQ